MTYFGRTDDEIQRRLSEFEAKVSEASKAAILEYTDLLISGRYARLWVRQVQTRLEEGRPWPISFGGAAELLTHLERIGFQLMCSRSNRSKEEERVWWSTYEAQTLESTRKRLPRLLETNFERNLLASMGRHGDDLGFGPRTFTITEEFLASELGKGDLITGLKVALRMVEEGIDGGIRSLRHMVVMARLRRRMDWAKSTLSHLVLSAENRKAVVSRIVEALNNSGLVSRTVTGLDVVCFSGQYVGEFIDAVSAGAFPRELG